MGTKKRKFYREKPAQEPQEEFVPEPEEAQEENEVGVRDMLIGAVVIIIILIVAFLSPNF